jgi:hypothetical protein
MRGAFVVGGVAAVALAAALSAPGRAQPVRAQPCGTVETPSSGAYLGVDAGDSVGDAAIGSFERLAGHRLNWVRFSQSWFRGLAFPRARVLTIWRHGAVPYVAFLPASGVLSGPGPKQRNPEERYSLQRIIDGAFDRQLRAWAHAARELGIPLLLSFGTDVNDDAGPWNARWNGAGETAGYGDKSYPDGAERYRDAYRHVVSLFRAEAVTNVSFVFDAAALPAGDDWNDVRLYYPGDAYVDWLGISVDGSVDAEGELAPFTRQVDESGVYTTLTSLSKRPVAIADLGAVENAAGEKAGWIRDAFRALRSGRYPRVKAVTWAALGGVKTRIDSSPGARAAFRSGVSGSYFAGHAQFGGDCRPPPPSFVTAKFGKSGRVLVRWQRVEVASSYEVYRNGKLVTTTRETSWVDPSAAPGPKKYTYTVRAVDPGGKSI